MRIEPSNILCAVDFSEYGPMVMAYGKALSKQFDARLCLCHVVSAGYLVSDHMTPYIDYVGLEAERIRDSQDRLEEMAGDMGIDCEVYVTNGEPAEVINYMVEENNIDLVIAATHGGSGFRRFLIGSVTDRLVKILGCPLLVLRPGEHPEDVSAIDSLKFERILVGCDFSPDSKQAVDYALSLAQEFEAQLHLAHVIRLMEKEPFWGTDEPQSAKDGISAWNLQGDLNPRIKPAGTESGNKPKVIERIEQQLLGLVPEDCQHWCTPVTAILEGQPYRELIDYADKQKVDLMVLGIHGHNFLERVIVGSTTDRVISGANCPVLAVRTTGKETK